jgi:chitinase
MWIPQSPTPPRTERRRIVASIAAALMALAGAAAVTLPASAARVTSARVTSARVTAKDVTNISALTAKLIRVRPYDSVLDSSGPDLGQVMSATGQKAFDLAFILASNNSSCSPAWNATDPVSSDSQVASVINEVRGDGGDVIVSAGGYNGTTAPAESA